MTGFNTFSAKYGTFDKVMTRINTLQEQQADSKYRSTLEVIEANTLSTLAKAMVKVEEQLTIAGDKHAKKIEELEFKELVKGAKSAVAATPAVTDKADKTNTSATNKTLAKTVVTKQELADIAEEAVARKVGKTNRKRSQAQKAALAELDATVKATVAADSGK